MNNAAGSVSTVRNFMGNAGRNVCNEYLYDALKDADEALQKQIAVAAISNGLTESAHKATVMTDLIDMQPTAYNLDSVIKKLEEKTDFAYKRYMDCSSDTPAVIHARYSAQYNTMNECLNIIKSGIEENTALNS